MNLTALLIGSDYGGLRGVGKDLATMTSALGARGFTTRVCPPPGATRAGILAAYETLIDDAEPGDAIVVYYTGHGGSAAPSGGSQPDPAALQFIVPVDYGESSEEDFRGISSVELSVLQARLTAVTRNVTVILDCCHSGLMSRDPTATIKAVGPAPYPMIRAHHDRLVRQGLRIDLVRGEGSPDAVRIVACAPEQRAYEFPGLDDGEWMGALTRSLTRTLAEVGDEPVTWATVVDRVRHQVVGLGFSQRPEAEGPANRLLFATEEADLLHSLPATPLDCENRVRLDCAALLRVQRGDEFVIMPPGQLRADPDRRVGDLRIDGVSAISAEGSVVFAPGWSAVPLGARAFRTKVTAPQVPVKVPAGDPRAGAVLDALQTAALARAAEPGEDWVGEVRISADGGFELCDRIGPLHPPYRDDPEGIADLAAAVKIFSQATGLRRLVGDPSHPLDAEVTIEWGLVVDGVAQPLASGAAGLTPGQRIYLTVRNEGQTPVYVSLLDIGVSGRISLLTRATPSGQLLPAGRSMTLGGNEVTRLLPGVALSWPTGLHPARARPETILVVLTSERQHLGALEQPEIVQTRSRHRGLGASTLQNLIDQLATGGTRDVESDWSDGVRYDIHAIDFEMAPEPIEQPAPPARTALAREGRSSQR